MNIQVIAEVVHGFVQWIDEHTSNLPYPVYFLSRDGNIFRKLSKRPSEFLFVSRVALWKASMFSKKDIYLYINRYSGIIRKARIYNMFDIPRLEDDHEILHEENIHSFIDKHADNIIGKSNENQKSLHKFFKRNDLTGNKIIIVDVGYGSTSQFLLNQHGIESIGFYLATNNYSFHHLDISKLETYGYLTNKRKDTYLFDAIMKNTNWLEPIFIGDLTDTVNGFDRDGMPLFEEHSFAPAQLKKMLEYHQYILEYKPIGDPNPAQSLFEFLTNTDFTDYRDWTRGKSEIRRAGLSFQPTRILFLSEFNSIHGRIAESCFNEMISETSRPYMCDYKVLDVSMHVVDFAHHDFTHLKLNGLLPSQEFIKRLPAKAEGKDFEKADIIVVLNENGSKLGGYTCLQKWNSKITQYWDINSSPLEDQKTGKDLQSLVKHLIDRLQLQSIEDPVGKLS